MTSHILLHGNFLLFLLYSQKAEAEACGLVTSHQFSCIFSHVKEESRIIKKPQEINLFLHIEIEDF